jgi:hypothetical protein
VRERAKEQEKGEKEEEKKEKKKNKYKKTTEEQEEKERQKKRKEIEKFGTHHRTKFDLQSIDCEVWATRLTDNMVNANPVAPNYRRVTYEVGSYRLSGDGLLDSASVDIQRLPRAKVACASCATSFRVCRLHRSGAMLTKHY